MTLSLSDENVDKSVIKIPRINFELVSNTFCSDSELHIWGSKRDFRAKPTFCGLTIRQLAISNNTLVTYQYCDFRFFNNFVLA